MSSLASNIVEQTAGAIPVVGRAQVCGGKVHRPTKIIERPPHSTAPATWHLVSNPELDVMADKGPLSREQCAEFFRDGFVFLPEFFDEGSLDSVRLDVEGMIDELATRLYKAGKIRDLYADLDWTSRLLRMRADFPDAPVVLIKGGILPRAMQRMFSDDRLLDIAAQLGVGPDVALNAAWNLRGKMPAHEETVVPWHQDNSYWEPRLWDEQVLTVWVALVDAVPENGCMQMVRGGHASGKTATHTIGSTTSTWYTEVSEETVARELFDKPALDDGDIVTVPAKAGSVLIFPGTTPHRSINSTSDRIRWSVDFRLHRRTPARPGKTPLDWFYGLKDSLLLRDGRSSEDDDGKGGKGAFEPDWASWATVERTAVQDDAVAQDSAELKESFDPVITGPWMDLWDLETDMRDGVDGCPRPNIHIERYMQTPEETRSTLKYQEAGNW